MKNYTKKEIDRAWFSCLLQHPARKWSWSILTTPKHAGAYGLKCIIVQIVGIISDVKASRPGWPRGQNSGLGLGLIKLALASSIWPWSC